MMWIWTILGMFLVTYSVRLVPFLAASLDDLPAVVKRGLRYVPPAALGALIFPDSLIAFSSFAGTGTGTLLALGALVVATLAYRLKPGIIVPVATTVVALVAILSLMGGASP